MAKKLEGVIVLHELLPIAPNKMHERNLNRRLWVQQQKLHMQEMDRLNSEIPLPDERTRGFVFRR